MKINTIITAVLIATAMAAVTGCNDSENNKKKDDDVQVAQLKEGQIVYREFSYGDKKIYLEDEMVNYGDDEVPVLFSVNRKIIFDFPELDGAVFATTEDELDAFFRKWADMRNMPYGTDEEKADVAYDVFDYFIYLDIDFNLFVQLTTEGYNLQALMQAETRSKTAGVAPNDVLYSLWAQRKEVTAETRGTFKEVIGIIEGIVELYNVWNDFVQNNQPIAEAVEGTCSFLNGKDTDVSNYSLDHYFTSPEYKLSYYVTGIMHSKFSYIIEGYTGTHNSLPGKYVTKCRINTTNLDVEGVAFIGSGSYKFSPVVNVSREPDNPTVQVNGSVQVVYGDCCCFRYFSYLNFSLRGDTGYSQLTFDTGK